jgi:polyisoprenoid-binding protein YceI
MRNVCFVRTVAAVLVVAAVASLEAADSFTVDPVHSSVSFQIEHFGISYIHGRFNKLKGEFSIDKDDASKSSITLTIDADSVDTNNGGRDKHLKSSDFFNVKQFPTIAFKSKSLKAVKEGYEVTGDLTMHGETKEISFKLNGGKEMEMKGQKRVGYWADLKLKRSDFGMKNMLEGIGDTVYISVGVEGTKK